MVSNEWLALVDADQLLDRLIEDLYVKGWYPILPSDGVTQTAFGALCGARRHIHRRMRDHVLGEATTAEIVAYA